jgi:hypothetical protein
MRKKKKPIDQVSIRFIYLILVWWFNYTTYYVLNTQ